MGFPTFYWVQNGVQHYKIIILACYFKRTTKGPTYLSLLRLLNTLNFRHRKQDCFRNSAYVLLQYLRGRHRRAVVAAVHADVVAHTILGGTWWGGTHHGCGSALRRWPHAVRRRSCTPNQSFIQHKSLQTYQTNLRGERTRSIETSTVEPLITSLVWSLLAS